MRAAFCALACAQIQASTGNRRVACGKSVRTTRVRYCVEDVYGISLRRAITGMAVGIHRTVHFLYLYHCYYLAYA